MDGAWHSGINSGGDNTRGAPGIAAYEERLAHLVPCLKFVAEGFERVGVRNKMAVAPAKAGGYSVARQVVDALMFEKFPKSFALSDGCSKLLYGGITPEKFKPFEADNWDWGSDQTIATISKAVKKIACELMLFDTEQSADPRGNPCGEAMQDCPGSMVA